MTYKGLYQVSLIKSVLLIYIKIDFAILNTNTFGFSLNFMVFVLHVQSIHIGFFWHKNEIKKVSIVETVVTQHKTVYKMI